MVPQYLVVGTGFAAAGGARGSEGAGKRMR